MGDTVVLVHGIFNHVRGAAPEAAAQRRAARLRPHLAEGLARIGRRAPAPEVAMAYYADLLRRPSPEDAQDAGGDPGFEDLAPAERALAAEWLLAAGASSYTEPQNAGLGPLRQALGALVGERGGPLTRAVRERTVRRLERVVVNLLREVTAYTTWPGRREAVRERVAAVIRRDRPAVVVAHSLGSLVAYETLHADPSLHIELFVTVGSPLRLPELLRRLDPPLRAGRGARPPGVARWVNIEDLGDLVAIPPKLSEVFPVDRDETVDTGLGFHGFGGYLSNGLTAAAMAPFLS